MDKAEVQVRSLSGTLRDNKYPSEERPINVLGMRSCRVTFSWDTSWKLLRKTRKSYSERRKPSKASVGA